MKNRINRMLLALVVSAFFMAAGNAFADYYQWEDTIDFTPDKYVGWWKGFSYSHDLTDNALIPFQVGEDTISSYSLTIAIHDDAGLCDFWEIAYIDQPGVWQDSLYNFSYSSNTLGWSLEGVLSLNATGILGVNIISFWGDFYVDYSTLIARGDNAPSTASSPVPEPATMLLFGAGLIGMGVLGRKKMEKHVNKKV